MRVANPSYQPGIPGKTGVVYTLDRETGEFLWATPTVTQNSEVVFSGPGQEVLACPSWIGGKDWEAGAYSPLTNTMYYPLRNTCARVLLTMEGGLALYGSRHAASSVGSTLVPGMSGNRIPA